MLIRLLNVKVRPGRQDEFRQALELLSIPDIQSRSGMIACYPGQPLGPNGNEFVLVTVWKDLATSKNHTEQEWAQAIIPAEAMPLVEDWHVQGYKSFGVLEQPLKPLFQNI